MSIIKINKNNIFVLAGTLILMLVSCISCAGTPDVPVDDESSVLHTQYDNTLIENEFRNDSGTLVNEEQIKIDSQSPTR